MIKLDDYVNENKTKHNKNWPYIPDDRYRILIRLRIWKNKCIIEFNRKTMRHLQNIFVC